LHATARLLVGPTATILPTPTNTLVAMPEEYDLPGWMGDPATNILADVVWSGLDTEVLFLNAHMGEQLRLPLPSDARRVFWFDNMHFGFLSNDLKTMHLVAMGTGQVASLPAPEESIRLLEADLFCGNLVVERDPIRPEEYVFDFANEWCRINDSENGQYYAKWDTAHQERPIIVTDLETQRVVWQSDPTDGYEDNDFAWSTMNEPYLAIVIGKPDLSIDFGFPVKDTTLLVIDVSSGEVVSSHKGDIGPIEWSPDGTKILYRGALNVYWNFGFGFTGAPCIHDKFTGETGCLSGIPNRPLPDGYSLLTTSSYRWSPDGRSVDFAYTYVSSLTIKGNLCTYDLLSGIITCPTDDLAGIPDWPAGYAGNGWSINSPDFSPDRQFVQFCFTVNWPVSDDQSGPSLNGLIKVDGTGFRSWAAQTIEYSNYTDTKCSTFGPIWRPLP
jgi:hypothetical protein